jgi:predicted ATPase
MFRLSQTIELNSSVTVFVGENGAGKSTLLELVASKLNLPRIAKDTQYQDGEFVSLKEALPNVSLNMAFRPQGFFFRSEDFITYIRFLEDEKAASAAELKRIQAEYKNRSEYARMMASSPHQRTISDIDSMYEKPLSEESHGESYLDFFASRLAPKRLYLMDEAEVPLSIENQLALLVMISNAVKEGCQFILSTHSPILMAYPNATIYRIGCDGATAVQYEEIESVSLMKDFLNNKERYLNRLFRDDA